RAGPGSGDHRSTVRSADTASPPPSRIPARWTYVTPPLTALWSAYTRAQRVTSAPSPTAIISVFPDQHHQVSRERRAHRCDGNGAMQAPAVRVDRSRQLRPTTRRQRARRDESRVGNEHERRVHVAARAPSRILEIGRASCREGGEVSVGGRALSS